MNSEKKYRKEFPLSTEFSLKTEFPKISELGFENIKYLVSSAKRKKVGFIGDSQESVDNCFKALKDYFKQKKKEKKEKDQPKDVLKHREKCREYYAKNKERLLAKAIKRIEKIEQEKFEAGEREDQYKYVGIYRGRIPKKSTGVLDTQEKKNEI